MNGCRDHARPWITSVFHRLRFKKKKNNRHDFSRLSFPRSPSLSRVDRENSSKRRKEKEGEREREREKRVYRSGNVGRNLFVSGRKNGRPVEAKPADCLVSGTCMCVCRSTRQSRRRAGTARAKM